MRVLPATKDRAVAVIEHSPGKETQWDWVKLLDPPAHWGWGRPRTCSSVPSRTPGAGRAVLCESEEQPHLFDGLDRVECALKGLTKDWRFDRMATVVASVHGEGVGLVRGGREA